MSRPTVSLEWATRQLRRASVQEIRRLVKRENYLTDGVFRLLVSRIDEMSYESPREGLQASGLLVTFGRKLGKEFYAEALGVRGSAYRSSGLYSHAREAYVEALGMVCSREVRTRLLQRFAALAISENRQAEALSLVEESMSCFLGSDLQVLDECISLTLRSKVRLMSGNHDLAIADARQALRRLSPSKHERVYLSAVHSVGLCVLGGQVGVESLRAVGRMITQVKRELRGKGSGAYRSVAWIFLDWIEAQINGRLGAHRLAVKQLEKVRLKFFEAGGGNFRNGVLASVDLAVVHQDAGDFDLARQECSEALRLARTMGFEAEAALILSYLSASIADTEYRSLQKGIRGIT